MLLVLVGWCSAWGDDQTVPEDINISGEELLQQIASGERCFVMYFNPALVISSNKVISEGYAHTFALWHKLKDGLGDRVENWYLVDIAKESEEVQKIIQSDEHVGINSYPSILQYGSNRKSEARVRGFVPTKLHNIIVADYAKNLQ